jgi:hypothetical protein
LGKRIWRFNVMATVTPNFNWPVPTSTDLVKDGATAIEALGDSIDASLVDLKGGTTGQVLSKASNTDMDFTWVTDAAGDITGVTAGTGLTGGGTSGTVSLAFDQTNFGGGQGAAGKNAVINGSMTNWQRGTSFTANGYTADRWYLSNATSNTISRSTDTPSGFTYSLKWDMTGAFPLLSTYIELPATGVKGQYTGNWTVSFWAKGSASYTLDFETAFNNGSNRTDRVAIGSNQTISLTTSWTKYTYTLDLTSPTINANNKAIELIFYSTTGTRTMYLTGMQFEPGSTATPFALAGGSIQGELAACQRYYYRNSSIDTNTVFGSGWGWTSTQATLILNTKVTMRTKPSALDYSSINLQALPAGTTYAITSWTLDTGLLGADTIATIPVVASGLTASLNYRLIGASSSAYVGLSAEL